MEEKVKKFNLFKKILKKTFSLFFLVVLPPSALEDISKSIFHFFLKKFLFFIFILAQMNLQWPLLFEIENPNTSMKVHCGVQEFIAEEGRIYMPNWMINNLNAQSGELIKIHTVTLPLGTYVKLQPQTSSFLEITNPKAV